MRKLRVDVWSDIACPWCFVGKRHLESAIRELRRDPGGEVEVRWRAFELHPGASRVPDDDMDYVGRLAAKYGRSRAEAQAMIDRMVEMGAERGLEFRFDRVKPARTFDAHRLLAFAARRDAQDALAERLFVAYMNEGRVIADVDTLVELAADVGLDPDEARAALSTDAYADEVRGDEAQAAQLGVTGVPFFVIGGRYAIPGAQPPEVIAGALRKAAAEISDPVDADAESSADACGPEGCDLPSSGSSPS